MPRDRSYDLVLDVLFKLISVSLNVGLVGIIIVDVHVHKLWMRGVSWQINRVDGDSVKLLVVG